MACVAVWGTSGSPPRRSGTEEEAPPGAAVAVLGPAVAPTPSSCNTLAARCRTEAWGKSMTASKAAESVCRAERMFLVAIAFRLFKCKHTTHVDQSSVCHRLQAPGLVRRCFCTELLRVIGMKPYPCVGNQPKIEGPKCAERTARD